MGPDPLVTNLVTDPYLNFLDQVISITVYSQATDCPLGSPLYMVIAGLQIGLQPQL